MDADLKKGPAPVSAVSAIAARRARQQQSQTPTPKSVQPVPESDEEPPAKKARPSPVRETNGHRKEPGKRSRQHGTRKAAVQQVGSKPETPDVISPGETISDISDGVSEEYTGVIADSDEDEAALSGQDEQG
jgi:polynucleotide 5'-hydroxyl-kinase GRC3/NOL9